MSDRRPLAYRPIEHSFFECQDGSLPRFHFKADSRAFETVELPSLSVAKCEAIKFASRIICDEAEGFWDSADWSLTVTDEQGLTLFQLQIIGTEAPVIATWGADLPAKDSPPRG